MSRLISMAAFLLLIVAASVSRGDFVGTWRGIRETPSGLGAMELTLSQEGAVWKGVFRLPEIDDEEKAFSVGELRLSDFDISFVAGAKDQSWQTRFVGKLIGDKIEGTHELFRSGKSLYSGLWRVKLSTQPASGSGIPARTLQPTNAATRQPPSEQTESTGVPELPAPTGSFTVGRTTFYWKDSSRPEALTDDPTDNRELMVTLWYPAQKEDGLSPAAYFPGYEFLRRRSSPPLPRSLKAHAFENAAVSDAHMHFPVILFSHGLGENTARYSALLEELASYGYVVAAIDHTYDNQGVVFPDGRVARTNDRWGWAISKSGVDEERFVLEQLHTMVADASFVLNRLNSLSSEEVGMFSGKLDMRNIGVFGHSLGGAMAPQVCQADERFKACLNQDGLPTAQGLILDPAGGKLERPFMFMGSSDPVTEEMLELMALTRLEYEELDRARRRRVFHILDRIPVESYFLSVARAEHSSFSDNPLLQATTLSTYRSRQRTLQVIRDYTRAFFDKYVMGKDAPLLDDASRKYPEVTIDRFGR